VRRKGNGPGASIFERLRRSLRGADHARAPALPVGEAMHPVALAAIALLVVNDWIWKPRVIPGSAASFVTGKLSDVAGLAFAPVVLSAAIGLALHAAARLGVVERAALEPSLAEAQPEERFQFERSGYFVADRVLSKPGAPVFNRTVTLRDSWAKIEQEALASLPAAARGD
jgi:hypothetical protein